MSKEKTLFIKIIQAAYGILVGRILVVGLH